MSCDNVKESRVELQVNSQSVTDSNVKKATATVTWYGCRRRKDFEGYRAVGKGAHSLYWVRPEEGRHTGNTANPKVGSGVQ